MGLRITGRRIEGDTTPHIAVMVGPAPWGWTVSYLPGRDFARSDAQAALHLAELVAQGQAAEQWQLLDRLAWYLELTAVEAIARLASYTLPNGREPPQG
jgi:hypothetical protein